MKNVGRKNLAEFHRSEKNIEHLDFATFLRKFEQRAEGVMWLLGAGASRASGIKTAGDMIWDFKARLYRSDRKVSASAVSDLGDSRIRGILQSFFDSKGEFPSFGAEDEYASYFETTYPNQQDRRRYVDDLMRGAQPSYGHFALAHLMKKDICRLIWTTNFDRVFEDAAAKVFETTSMLTVGDLGEPERIKTAFSQQHWPIYAKLHGDFQSEALKNTTAELALQDEQMRQVFLDACRNQGLAISGYSGRDSSILDVLREAISDGAGFPNGLFWFVREQETPYQGVIDLIAKAKSNGIDADFVKAESFDELFSDIVRYLPQTEQLVIDVNGKTQRMPRKIDLSVRKFSIPFIRTNAIPIIDYPQTCRLVECDIGGARDLQELLSEKGSSLVASRIKKGVLIFGDDGEIKKVFQDHSPKNFGTHGIIAERLSFESGERSLLRDALFRGLAAFNGLSISNHRGRTFIRADECTKTTNFGMQKLTSATSRLHGILPNGKIPWTEACRIRLDYRLDRLWILLGPYVHIEISKDVADDDLAKAREFIRERRVKRYNKQSNHIIDGWVEAIFGGQNDVIELGVDGGTGIGARFEVMPVTGFSGLSR